MCGIAGGAWNSPEKALSPETLNRMTSVLAHRGPDDSGHWFSSGAESSSLPAAALGHRRLSIIDLAGGHQPLGNEDGTIQIAFNGEIYNYRELQARLEQQGHRFRTDCDTETIVHLYEEYGPDCVHHLRGMFAFALWDDRQKVLLLARDRLGQKPLFYRAEAGRLVFASELKALLQIPGAPRELNPEAVDLFLTYQYVPWPHCILQGYSKLPPAHRAIYTEGRLRVERYWSPPGDPRGEVADADTDLPDSGNTRDWSPQRWREELRSTLTESVRLRMRSDVPLGAFLSGGVDSTIIAGLMQQLSDRPIHTFSIGFPVERFDERSYARQAAAHLGTTHHEQVVEPSALKILPRLIWHYDEPFADSSAIPTMELSEMTRREVTVALSGDGGDELFAGYDRYRAVELAGHVDRLPGPLRRMAGAGIWQKLPASVEQRSLRRRMKRFLSAVAMDPMRRYLQWIGIFDESRRAALYSPEFQERLLGHDAAQWLIDAYRQCPGPDFLTRTTCVDVLTYLPCDILTKVDIASMSCGLEARSPFLDHHVAELTARMPMRLKRKGRIGKQILLETFSDLLPPAIRNRAKMGFGVPLDHWFRGELKPLLHDTLLDSRSTARGLFRTEEVRRLIDEHTSARWDHSYRLWALLVLELWQRTWLDPAQAPATP